MSHAPTTRARRAFSLFLFAYLLLYSLPLLEPLWDALLPPLGRALLGVELNTQYRGSGDRLFDYVRAACCLGFSLLLAGFFSARRPTNPAHLDRLSRWWARYYLGIAMLGYGLAKIFRSQFADLPADWFATPLGEASPMGLVWRFMGSSAPYAIIAGLLEFIGGLLLLFPRTSPAGALFLLPVLGNVVLLNFCYDVPVKLGSTHYFLIALVLSAPSLRTVFELLVLRRPVAPPDLGTAWDSPRAKRFAAPLRVLLLVLLGGGFLYQRQSIPAAPGIVPRAYQAASLPARDDKAEVPAPETWEQLFIDSFGWVAVRAAHGESFYLGSLDPQQAEKLFLREAQGEFLQIEKTPDGLLRLSGTFQGKALRAEFVPKALPLVETGFHWVQEAPNNR
jgi:uncharacterized membrane protein YphA (DoxX/SURF4 family)